MTAGINEGSDQKLPGSAGEARAVGSTHYFTGKLCKNGHLSKRRISDNKCLECNKASAKSRRANPKTNKIINKQRREWRHNNPDRYHKQLESKKESYWSSGRFRKSAYFSFWSRRGITEEVYTAISEEQNGLCAICRKEESKQRSGRTVRLSIDHCHSTGRVRGLLCSRCNEAIGKAKDDPDIIEAAIEYLKSN